MGKNTTLRENVILSIKFHVKYNTPLLINIYHLYPISLVKARGFI